ncbi:hypothetical protein [Ruficoccus sp. ZRK36]|uniref:hypothetical protein n=1 Tax=Ruficoccus sp. ZRK36 TaxID=2866311 RepID=UPI001C73D1AB|nr:hypothetical protein [Ruficoccus sp. ZRK36]QYY34520.1 hypothetical protein K0V07_09390 [Ruficoccus sp. ZRK36]
MHKLLTSRSTLLRAGAITACVALACAPFTLRAGDVYNWKGTPWYDGWSSGANWAGGVAPPSQYDDPAAANTIMNFGKGTYSFNDGWIHTQKEINFKTSLGNSTYTIDNHSSEKIFKFTNSPVISVNHTGTAIINSGIDLHDDILITGDHGGTLIINGAVNKGWQWDTVAPNGGITKEGNSTLVLTGSENNNLNSLNIQDGTVVLDKSNGATAVTGNISVSGGTLLLASSNQIDNNTSMELAGGNFATGGNSETLGSLTLSSASTIDLGEGGTLNFADSSSSTWSGTLLITNWGNNNSESEFSQIYFGTDASSLTADQVNSISFVNPEGMAPGIYGAKLLANGQLVPFSNFSVIPEPSTVMGGILLTLGAAYMGWRSRRKKLTDATE